MSKKRAQLVGSVRLVSAPLDHMEHMGGVGGALGGQLNGSHLVVQAADRIAAAAAAAATVAGAQLVALACLDRQGRRSFRDVAAAVARVVVRHAVGGSMEQGRGRDEVHKSRNLSHT